MKWIYTDDQVLFEEPFCLEKNYPEKVIPVQIVSFILFGDKGNGYVCRHKLKPAVRIGQKWKLFWESPVNITAITICCMIIPGYS